MTLLKALVVFTMFGGSSFNQLIEARATAERLKIFPICSVEVFDYDACAKRLAELQATSNKDINKQRAIALGYYDLIDGADYHYNERIGKIAEEKLRQQINRIFALNAEDAFARSTLAGLEMLRDDWWSSIANLQLSVGSNPEDWQSHKALANFLSNDLTENRIKERIAFHWKQAYEHAPNKAKLDYGHKYYLALVSSGHSKEAEEFRLSVTRSRDLRGDPLEELKGLVPDQAVREYSTASGNYCANSYLTLFNDGTACRAVLSKLQDHTTHFQSNMLWALRNLTKAGLQLPGDRDWIEHLESEERGIGHH